MPTPSSKAPVTITSAYWLNYGTRIGAVGATFLVGIVAARGLGPEGRGAYAFAATLAGTLVQLLNGGLSSSFLYYVSRRRSRVGELLALTWLLACVWLLLGLLIRLFLPNDLAGHPTITLLSFWAPIQLGLLLQDQLYLGSEPIWHYSVVQVGGRALSLLMAFAVTNRAPGNVSMFLTSLVAADAATFLIGGVTLATRSGGLRLPRVAVVSATLRLAARAFPVLLLPFLLVKSDILLMRVLRTSAETGIYAVAAQIVDGVLLLPSAFAAILFVSYSSAEGMVHATSAGMHRVGIAMSVIALGILVIGKPVIAAVFGKAFEGAFWPLLLLLPGAVALGVQNIVTQYYSRLRYPPFLTLAWTAGLLLNVSINLVLIPRLGAYGAALASSLSYVLVATLLVRRFHLLTGRR